MKKAGGAKGEGMSRLHCINANIKHISNIFKHHQTILSFLQQWISCWNAVDDFSFFPMAERFLVVFVIEVSWKWELSYVSVFSLVYLKWCTVKTHFWNNAPDPASEMTTDNWVTTRASLHSSMEMACSDCQYFHQILNYEAILSRGIPTSPLCRLKCTAGCRSTQDVVAGTPLQLGKSTGFNITPGCLNGWKKKLFLPTTRVLKRFSIDSLLHTIALWANINRGFHQCVPWILSINARSPNNQQGL